jgi:hypothetical protein
MESRYYHCRVTEADRPQRLDDYELGLQSKWVGLSHAAEVNQRMIDGGRPAFVGGARAHGPDLAVA